MQQTKPVNLEKLFFHKAYINTKKYYIESIKHLIKMTLTGKTQDIINCAFIAADAKEKYLNSKYNYRKYM